MTERPPNRGDLALFLVVAFGGSWGLAGLVRAAGFKLSPLVALAVGVPYMFFPALGALLAERRRGATLRKAAESLGISFRPDLRWAAVGWVGPIVLAWLAFAVALALPDVQVVHGTAGILDKYAAQMPPEKLAEAKAKLESIPVVVFLGLTTLQALIAAVSINAVAALGEELGWRGYLDRAVRPLGFWRGAWLTGLLWGPWHAGLVLQGYNYPQHPVAGVGLMTAMTVLLSPLLSAVRRGGRSVLAAAVAHGSINASAGFGVMFLKGGSDLTVGLTGAAGLLVLGAANVALWLWLRRHPLEPAPVL